MPDLAKEVRLRAVNPFAYQGLRDLAPLFDEICAQTGRSSIPPERLLKVKLLQAFYTIRSESLLVEMLDYTLLFNLMDDIWDNSTFTTNQARLIECDTAAQRPRTVRVDKACQQTSSSRSAGNTAGAVFGRAGASCGCWAWLGGTRKEGWLMSQQLSKRVGERDCGLRRMKMQNQTQSRRRDGKNRAFHRTARCFYPHVEGAISAKVIGYQPST